MTDPTPPLPATEILTHERLLKAVRAEYRSPLAPYVLGEDRQLGAEHPDLQLTETERETIRQALIESPRLLAKFAYTTLQRWDDLWASDRVEALDLFADVVHSPYFHRRPLSIEPTREITR